MYLNSEVKIKSVSQWKNTGQKNGGCIQYIMGETRMEVNLVRSVRKIIAHQAILHIFIAFQRKIVHAEGGGPNESKVSLKCLWKNIRQILTKIKVPFVHLHCVTNITSSVFCLLSVAEGARLQCLIIKLK